MYILLAINPGLIAPQLPDDIEKFRNQQVVSIDNKPFLFADYTGLKWIESDHNVNDYIASLDTSHSPNILELTNIVVQGDHVTLGNGGIWWIPQNERFELTANVALPDTEMMIIIERVANGSNVIDDIRVKAQIIDGVVTINGVFSQSGNYQITAERLNAGLEIIEAPFRLAFDKVEFDAYV